MNQNPRRTYWLLFVTHLFTRVLFAFAVGFYNNYGLQADSHWLVGFADQALTGNFNFELDRFIASPLFPLVCAGFKFFFGSFWNTALIVFQLVISAVSGVYIFKIAKLLFKNEKTALIASLIFAAFPLTLWFVNTFSQECLFQALVIFAMYYLLRTTQYSEVRSLILSAVLFSLAYLTKSHVLLFIVFVPLIFYHSFGLSKKTILYSYVFGCICLFFSVPYGFYQLKKNDTYVISSNGSGYQLYLGNTEAGYITIVDVPEKNTDDFRRMKNINETAGYFNGSQQLYDSILKLPQKDKQRLFSDEAWKWIQSNPVKFLKLKFYDAVFYLLPGVSFRHYGLMTYLFSFLFSLPIYLFAYIVMGKEIRQQFVLHSFMFYIFLAMLLFSVIWYTQNRFKTITIEPFYIIYASVLFSALIEKIGSLRKVFAAVEVFYSGGKAISR